MSVRISGSGVSCEVIPMNRSSTGVDTLANGSSAGCWDSGFDRVEEARISAKVCDGRFIIDVFEVSKMVSISCWRVSGVGESEAKRSSDGEG